MSIARSGPSMLLGRMSFRSWVHLMVLVSTWTAGMWSLSSMAGTEVDTRSATSNWWAFKPVTRPVPPSGSLHPIDAFIAARLREKKLQPNPPASPREKVRRLFFNLTGLPPSYEEVEAFEKNPSPEAWRALIDQLLASPQYGVRWARHWLDVTRFAQSTGYERDAEKLFAWRYRDYVVDSLNTDKPYDRFVREQLAGDEMIERKMAQSGANAVSDQERRAALTATAFYRLGVYDDEPDDKLLAEYEELDDVMNTIGASFLGLTLGCARCHEHKFDPISQADYYSMLAFLRGVRLSEAPKQQLESSILLPLARPEEIETFKRRQQERIAELQAQLGDNPTAEAKKQAEEELTKTRSMGPDCDWTLGVKETTNAPATVTVLKRGNPRSPGEEVKPSFLGAIDSGSVFDSSSTSSAGRRTALADWIASPRNPLTARVIVNRIWHHHFGRGIVSTTTDFGRAGTLPTHPELLDWLASEFVSKGWSIKELHRVILTSETWQRSSAKSNAEANLVDPGNELLWRQNLRRLDAEVLRDMVLKVSGKLNLEMGGRGFFPKLSGEVLAGGSRPGMDWDISTESQRSRRSLYMYIRRTSLVPIMEVFDYSNATSPLGERVATTVAPQALMMLNDEFLQQQAKAMALKLESQSPAGLKQDRIESLWKWTLARKPSPMELSEALAFLERETKEQAEIRTRMTFRPETPDTLYVNFFNKLTQDSFLSGPENGWERHRGRWPKEYEANKTLEPGQGPFALAKQTQTTNGLIQVNITPHIGSECSSILFRARADQERSLGYELALHPAANQVVLRWHSPTSSVDLAHCPAPIKPGSPLSVKIRFEGPSIQIWTGSKTLNTPPDLQVTHDQLPLVGGQVGIRVWGAAGSYEQFSLTTPERTWDLSEHSVDRTPEQRAWENLCLLSLNLNEAVYVD
ncbi:MAG: DUF1553 domain-containing protein [Verrucomicrobia bacterium]|nr:DUF1553 domain-containing protein [Verrucomicrobiota bacterium]